ncbi:sensor histidine kinase [Methylophilus aquaticus]|uniref:histidine kinase n=1 Tax=Methylophilus aquaticus TaxID=1971610 RepID=A0ABT9JPF1_9PROT|nr:sensor histidine kinase [Methylophilus aquaticus]MDP8566448.1 sensor histidine kinase [Methylophilus aquaticus]
MLLIAFLLAGLLPALLVSLLSFYQARQALRIEIQHDLQTTGKAVAEHIDRVLFERIQNITSWSQLAIMQDMQIGDIDKRLSIFLAETGRSYAGQYASIDVVDLESRVIASSKPANIGQLLGTPPVWMSFQENKHPIIIYHLTNQQLMISAPVISQITLQPLGHLVATFNWHVIGNMLDHAAQHSTELALVDSRGHLLAQSNNWSDKKHSLHTRAPLASTLPTTDWQIILNKDHDVAVAPVHRLGLIFVVLLGLILGFSLLLVRPIGQNISRPLEALTRYVQRLRQPDAVPPVLSGPSEVQALHQAFTRMTEELAESEQQLTQAAKLAVVGEMAAAMSHEVRTPLGILRSSADVLLREPQLSSDGREVLGFIISETERLNKLVSALIDSARPRLPNKIPLELQSHLQHVTAMLQNQAASRNIALSLHGEKPVTVAADQDQMTQVLLNLLMNAIQILPEGGHIDIRLSTHDNNALISVADNGPGVPLSQQPHLFEAFFTQRAGGVGLGLAVVKQIVEAHGGKISYCTSQWQGAQFNLTFPLSSE